MHHEDEQSQDLQLQKQIHQSIKVKLKNSNLYLEDDDELPLQLSQPQQQQFSLEELIQKIKKGKLFIALVLIILTSLVLSFTGDGDADADGRGFGNLGEIGAGAPGDATGSDGGNQGSFVQQIVDETVDPVVTSSQLLFPNDTAAYRAKLETVMTGLKQKIYEKDQKYKQSPDAASAPKSDPPKAQPLKQWAQQANKNLVNPEYPAHTRQIMSYQPYLQLPFCLFVKQTQQHPKSYHEEVARSIFKVNYTNFITVFFAYDTQGLAEDVLNKLADQAARETGTKRRMFYKLTHTHPTYHEYRYLAHQLCPEKSYLLFPSTALKNTTLQILNNFHQLYPVFLTYSENNLGYFLNSFAMRLMDLLPLNDFRGTMKSYFGRQNQEKLIMLGVVELGARFAKKFKLEMIYDETFMAKTKVWVTSIPKTDITSYTRSPYQPLLSLSQTTHIEIPAQTEILSKLKSETEPYKPNERTELTTVQMLDAIEYEDIVYLPDEASLGRRQFVQRDLAYGLALKYDKPVPRVLKQRAICAAVFTEAGATEQQKKRYLKSVQSVLNQNYSNFHTVLIDNTLDPAFDLSIQTLLKSSPQPQNLSHVKPKIPLPATQSILVAAFEHCQAEEFMAIIDADFQLLNRNFFVLINNVHGYNRHLWAIYANFKTEGLRFGWAYRLVADSEYRGFEGRVAQLMFMAPLLVAETKLVRSIPLSYHQDQNGQWLTENWHKAFQHAITELATVTHIEYIPEIQFEASDVHIQKYTPSPTLQAYIASQQMLKPLASLSSKYLQHEKAIKHALALGMQGAQGSGKLGSKADL